MNLEFEKFYSFSLVWQRCHILPFTSMIVLEAKGFQISGDITVHIASQAYKVMMGIIYDFGPFLFKYFI